MSHPQFDDSAFHVFDLVMFPKPMSDTAFSTVLLDFLYQRRLLLMDLIHHTPTSRQTPPHLFNFNHLVIYAGKLVWKPL